MALISKSFGGINLEDISAPRCFEIEAELKKRCDIPVFHDDQHGTAIVVSAALLNAIKVIGKTMGELKIVINGAGAAGISIAKMLLLLGFGDVILCDIKGAVYEGADWTNPAQAKMAEITNRTKVQGTLADVMKGADVFIGVSRPNLVSREMVRSMADGAIVFPMANPVPVSYTHLNHYSARISLYRMDTGELLGNTRRVYPGRYVETIQLNQDLPIGEHPVRAVVELFRDKTPAGSLSLELTLWVMGQEESGGEAEVK